MGFNFYGSSLTRGRDAVRILCVACLRSCRRRRVLSGVSKTGDGNVRTPRVSDPPHLQMVPSAPLAGWTLTQAQLSSAARLLLVLQAIYTAFASSSFLLRLSSARPATDVYVRPTSNLRPASQLHCRSAKHRLNAAWRPMKASST